MITILNSSVLTGFGTYTYEEISIAEAKRILQEEDFQSAIGHESTAALFSELIGVEIPFNRIDYRQQTNEKAIVFKIKKRLSLQELGDKKKLDENEFELAILTKLK